MSDFSPIDWNSAIRVAVQAAPTGPTVTPLEAARAVADLREFSRDAERAVREVTGMGAGLPVLDGTVVDRPGWIAATAEGMAILTEPMTAKMAEQAKAKVKGRHSRVRSDKPPSGVAAAPIGAVLGYLSGKVLGQYDPFPMDSATGRPGRLLLVAPNILKVERELRAEPRDFRMWVCLHESTHRLQFTAVPWLREHFRGLVARFADEADLDPHALVERIRSAWRNRAETGASWIEATQTPGQRDVFDRLLALMTLLEGHADYVMDAVGPRVVPSVERIRAQFNVRRRKGAGPIDRLIRSVLGMDVKLQQYVQGGAFVHAVVDSVGMARFNAVWNSPEHLPTRAEIADPPSWVARVTP